MTTGQLVRFKIYAVIEGLLLGGMIVWFTGDRTAGLQVAVLIISLKKNVVSAIVMNILRELRAALPVLLLLGMCLLLSSPASAWQVELGASGQQGTVNTKGGSAAVKHQGERFSFNTSYAYKEAAGLTSVDKGHAHLGYDRTMGKRWEFWSFIHSAFNKIQGISIENFAGLGPKYTFYKGTHGKASFSLGYLHHYTEYEGGWGDTFVAPAMRCIGTCPPVRVPGPSSKLDHRISARLKASYKDKTSSAAFVLFYQPSVDETSDYIVSGETWYMHKVSGALSLKALIEGTYRSTLVQPQEITQWLSLVWKLGGK